MEKSKTTTQKSESVLKFVNSSTQPVSYFEIRKALHLHDHDIEYAVNGLIRRHLLLRSFSGKVVSKNLPRFTGSIYAHAKGFGFITTEEGHEFFVPPAQMANLVGGDEVNFVVFKSPKDGRESAEIMGIVKRPESFWLGTVNKTADGWQFTPDEGLNPTVVLDTNGVGINEGETVQIVIAAGTPAAPQVPAKVVQSLGQRGRKGFDTDYAIAKWLIPVSFSEAAQTQTANFDSNITVHGDYRDLRDLPLMTIDGESTRDFDDAVYAVREKQGYRLWVAIADVSHYVTPDSALDNDAKVRATSVYFPERTLPMLPERLSNELCSLNPGMDRYTLVCEMQVSQDSEITDARFYPAVICSHARLTYNQVTRALQGLETVSNLDALVVLRDMHLGLRQRRQAQGMLEFNSKEPKLEVVDDEIKGITWLELTVAHHIVEECMLAANRSAAGFLKVHGVFPLYRHHAVPEGEDWEASRQRLSQLGFDLHEQTTLLELSEVLAAARGRDDFSIIEENVRRAMRPAVYDVINSSHFSLGFEAYTHFTSPIRRYPDLLVHRAIKAILAGHLRENFDNEALVEHCSMVGRRANQATRYVWTLIKRRHIAQFIGTDYEAKVILGNKRGVKVVLQDWDTAAWLPSESLEAQGWHWQDDSEQWAQGAMLEPGVMLQVTLRESTDKEVMVKLAGPANVHQLAVPA